MEKKDDFSKIKDQIVSSFNEFSQDKKIAVVGSVIMIISVLFFPWISFSGKGVTLMTGEETIHAL